eukprot:TRINITY_DN43126_c0_g1_i1.p1 TRINITY_DN43126_c0_g1~~TRINITY_DN43126_c0_g1_i1.p1  ORF type:complete len:422 (-),score=42.84 TRINITY_DN43126_c0_g1_i1:59-1201(-)
MDSVWCLAALDDQTILSGSEDNTINAWRLDDGSLVQTLTGHTDGVRCFAVLEGGRIASGSRDMSIKIWGLGEGSIGQTLTGHTGDVWCMVASEGGARPSSRIAAFEDTLFASLYRRDKACQSPSEVWSAVETFLATYLGCPVEATAFRRLLEANVQATASDPALMHKLLSDPSWVAARCWTSPQRAKLVNKEWCGMLQDALRQDSRSCMEPLVKLFATLNEYCVVPRSPTAASRIVPWPEDNLLYRGGRLPRRHAAWFVQAIDEKTVFRARGAVPTTAVKSTAITFMIGNSYPLEAKQALWIYSLDPVQKCMHVNCLEPTTVCAGAREIEFLFAPYSAFQATRMEWKEEHCIIHLNVIPSNTAVKDGGTVPDKAPLSPWY